jgi:pimeloyl-ACP methyl ester carboxylesterase
VQARTQGPHATVAAALDRWFTPAAPAGLRDTVRGWVLANDPAVYPQIYAILAEGVEELVDPRPPVACPALVLTADQDSGNTPDMARAIAAGIAGADLVILPGLRHMALAEDPAAVNVPLTAFLRRHLLTHP